MADSIDNGRALHAAREIVEVQHCDLAWVLSEEELPGARKFEILSPSANPAARPRVPETWSEPRRDESRLDHVSHYRRLMISKSLLLQSRGPDWRPGVTTIGVRAPYYS